MKNSSRIALYLRVSTREQSFRSQERILRDYCKRRGWSNTTDYREKVSGTKDGRKVLQDLMNDARAGKIDVVVVYKLDRWGRSLLHALSTIQELVRRKVGFISATEGIDLTEGNPTGHLMMSIFSALAEFEGSRIRERVNAGLAVAKAKGKVFGRPRANDAAIAEAVKLRGEGRTLAQISAAVGLSVSYLSRIFRNQRAKQ